ncbi:MAG: metallophosphoesterase family protein [Chloroflexota bacterium]
MKVLVISDIHANLTALETVLADADEYDTVWCLGDLVGYGPDPNECIDLVRGLSNLVCILGNHDAAALKQIGVEAFNPDAQRSVLWMQEQLSSKNVAFLKGLPEKVVLGEVTIAHGSPRKPVWEYILDVFTATINFESFDTPYCFVGHTHVPLEYRLIEGRNLALMSYPEPKSTHTLIPRTIINPGSVGQPRDRDPRAAYALFDTETSIWESRRVEYDIITVQDRMRSEGFPTRHIERLSVGW